MVVAEAQQLIHNPDRATYNCRGCGLQWPCPPAREELVRDNDMVQLAILMWGSLEDAAKVLRHVPADKLFERFLSWTGPRP